MRLEPWYARLVRSFPKTSRTSSRARYRRRREATRLWSSTVCLSRTERLEDRTLLSAAPGTPGNSSTLPQLTPAQITALDQYVAAPDSSYQFSLNSTITGTGYTDYVINMVSQTWTPSPGDSEVWQHWVQIIVPSNVNTHTAILNISGGSNSATAPTSPDQTTLAAATTLNAIAVFLPTVPNEPVTFPAQGETTPLTEDQIVAYTFEQFLNGNGQDWPLLLPMVKSAVRAMDTTQSFVSSQSDGTLSVDNFIVTGASKRGWTTWLTPAVDTRVIAIVPFVFDGLNLPDQIESQLDTYVGVTQDVVNGDSTAVQDYTNDGVFDFIGTPQMAALDSIVDPFSYIDRSTYNIPKYLVDSTGDQFFVPDAQFFFSDLPGQNYLRYVPNTDHGLNTDAVTGAINFEEALVDGAALPQFSWNVTDAGTTITLNSTTTPTSVTMWQATNTTNRDFRLETFGANWTSSTLSDQGGGTYVAHVTPPATGATDFFIQMQYSVDGVTLTFTTQISTVPLLTPTVTVTDNTGFFNGSAFAATATATGLAGLPVPGDFTYTYYAGATASGTPLASAPTTAGTYTVVTSFDSSDPDYVDASSLPLTFQIREDTPVLTLSDLGGSYNDTPYPATGTIAGVVTGVDDTPGSSLEGVPLTLTYFSGTTATGTPLSGAPTAAGTYTVEASFAGSQDYIAARKTDLFFVTQDRPVLTLTDLGGSYNDTPYPATATIAGVVTGVDDTPGGSLEGVPVTLTYYAGTTATGTPLPGPPTIAGTYTVEASFAGSQDYLAVGRPLGFFITQDRPVLTLSDLGGSYNDTPYPATGTIAGVVPGVDNTPGSSLEGVPLTLTYYVGTGVSGTPLPGPPSAAGTYTVDESFAGSQDYIPVGRFLGFFITQDRPVITVSDLGGSYNGSPYGGAATIAGVVAGVDNTPGGSLEGVPVTLTYFVGTGVSGTPLSGAPTTAGTYTVEASFAGSQDYIPVGTSTGFFITQDRPVLTLTPPSGTYDSSPFPATATIAGVVPGLDNSPGSNLEGVPVTLTYYAGTSTSTPPLSGPPTDAGVYLVAAAFAGSLDYLSTQSLVAFQIGQAPPTVVTSDPGGDFTGSPYPATATATGVGGATVGGTFAFTYYVGNTVNGNGSSTAPSAPGTYTVVAAFTSSDSNYVTGPTNSLPVVFTINSLSSPPSISAPATASLAENTSFVFSTGSGNAITVADSNAGSSVEQLTLTVTKGTVSLATTSGITVTSGANGSASMTLQGTLAHLNAALNGLQFTPTNGFTGSASLAVSYKDLANNQTANGSVSITVVAPPVTAFVNAFLPIVVPGEPVPVIIGAIDTSLQAQFSLFKVNISFGDGNTASLTSYVPLLVNHIYKKVGVYTVSVTATDEFGRTSAPATVVIHVVSLFFGLNPFNTNQTALFIGEMPGDTVSVTAAPGGGIAVTLNGVSQGVFNVTGPVILLGQQPTKSPVGLSVNQNPLVQTPTAASLENQLDSEALQWAGLSAATEILNE
jgi:PhoPQ-activated pathogenicity-related protein